MTAPADPFDAALGLLDDLSALLDRLRKTAPFTLADLPVVRYALVDAIAQCAPPEFCPDCIDATGPRCLLHAGQHRRRGQYRELLARIGEAP